MQEKTIAKVLKTKFRDWVDNITDEKVRKLVEQNTIITGGCISSMRMGEGVNDYDVYFTNKETVLAVANYYVDLFNKKHYGKSKNRFGYEHLAMVIDGDKDVKEQVEKYGEWKWETKMLEVDPSRVKIIIRSDGVAEDNSEDSEYLSREELDEVNDRTLHSEVSDPQDILEKADDEIIRDETIDEMVKNDGSKIEGYPKKYKPVFLSTNAVTLSSKIQCVIRFYGDAEEIHSNFDFVHVTGYWKSSEPDKVQIPLEAVNSMVDRQLIYRGSKYPLATLVRIRKYIKRGWNINAGQLLKIAYQLHDLDLYNIKVLEDQLLGVDTMYFKSFLNTIQAHQVSDESLDRDYVVSVIEKVFG